MYSWI